MINIAIYIILLILTIILHYSIYYWTIKLKKINCKCSEGNIRNILNILALIFILLIPYRILNYKDKYFTIFFNNFIAILTIIYFILIIYYINKLNIESCKCSDDWKKNYSLIITIIFSLLILFLLILKLILFSNFINK